jgi:hypothetical protein
MYNLCYQFNKYIDIIGITGTTFSALVSVLNPIFQNAGTASIKGISFWLNRDMLMATVPFEEYLKEKMQGVKDMATNNERDTHTHTSFIENSTEAGNLLRGNGKRHSHIDFGVEKCVQCLTLPE